MVNLADKIAVHPIQIVMLSRHWTGLLVLYGHIYLCLSSTYADDEDDEDGPLHFFFNYSCLFHIPCTMGNIHISIVQFQITVLNEKMQQSL